MVKTIVPPVYGVRTAYFYSPSKAPSIAAKVTRGTWCTCGLRHLWDLWDLWDLWALGDLRALWDQWGTWNLWDPWGLWDL